MGKARGGPGMIAATLTVTLNKLWMWVVTVSVLLEAIHLEKVVQRQITEVYLKEKQKEEHKMELKMNS